MNSIATGEQTLNSRFLVKQDVKAVTMYLALCIDSEETPDYIGQHAHAYEWKSLRCLFQEIGIIKLISMQCVEWTALFINFNNLHLI